MSLAAMVLPRAVATLVLCTVLCAGCVTQTESVFTEAASPQKALEQRVALARRYIGEGNWEDAKRNLQKAAAIDDRNAEVYEAFALVYQSTGEYELAEDNYRRAIELNRSFSRARNNYAAFLFSRKRFEEAEAQLERVVQDTLYNARPLAFVNLGLCRQRLGRNEAAEEAFRRALSMDRDQILALQELALLRFEAGDYDEAGKLYGRYRDTVRFQSARGLWLGVRLARARGDKDAESSYALALTNLYPDSPELAAYRRTLKAPVSPGRSDPK